MESNEEPINETPDASSADSEASSAKADVTKRFLGQFIDGIIAGAIFWLLIAFVPGWYAGYILGCLIAGGYFLVRDGLDLDFMKQRSLGKKLMKLRPVRLDGQPMDLETSIKRNWMFGVVYVAYLPFLGILGRLFGLAAAVLILYECYKVLTDKGGRRWGDEFAGTQVIESAE